MRGNIFLNMKAPSRPSFIERIVSSIGSVTSLVVHTILFAASFLLAITGLVDWSFMLLICRPSFPSKLFISLFSSRSR